MLIKSVSISTLRNTHNTDSVHPPDAGDGLSPEHVHWVCDAKQHPHPLPVRLAKTTFRDISIIFNVYREVFLHSLGPGVL